MNLLSRLHKFFFVEGIKRIGKLLIIGAAFVAAGVIIAAKAVGQAPPDTVIPRVPNPPLKSDLDVLPGDLRAVAVPTPPNLDEFVRDPAMARALGKALFWDMQVGSDGVQACASCHFRAGADPRSKNQVSPGLKPDFRWIDVGSATTLVPSTRAKSHSSRGIRRAGANVPSRTVRR